MLTRAFLAIPLADELKTQLDHWIRAMENHIQGVRWVPARELHVTLYFLGEVTDETLETLDQRLNQIVPEIPAAQLEVQGAGVFKSLRQPRILWVGTPGDVVTLSRLHRDLGEALRGLDVDQDARKQRFHPHITIGRVKHKERPRGLEFFLKAGNYKYFGEFPLDEVVLFRSELTRQGARYSRIQTYKLGE